MPRAPSRALCRGFSLLAHLEIGLERYLCNAPREMQAHA